MKANSFPMRSETTLAQFWTSFLFVAALFGSYLTPSRAGSKEIPAVPPTVKIRAVETYFDHQVPDDYQWLEIPDDPKVVAWTKQQTARTRKYLDSISERKSFLKEFRQNIVGKTVEFRDVSFIGGKVFAIRYEPPKAQPMIILTPDLEPGADQNVIFDPVALDPKGLTSFDWYVPSPDGSTIALSLSDSGSESGALRFLRVSDGKLLDDRIEHVQFATAGGSAAWAADGKGVFYTRYPRKGERPDPDLNLYQQIYYHPLGGADAADHYELGKDFPRIAETMLLSSPHGEWILATVSNGDGGEYAHYLRDKTGKWTQITQFADGVKQIVFGGEKQIFLLSVKNAPRGEVLRIDLSNGAQTITESKACVPEADDSAIQDLAASEDDLLVNDIIGGPSRVRHFNGEGKYIGKLPIPELAAVSAMTTTEAGDFLLAVSSYTKTDKNLRYSPKTDKFEETGLKSKIAVNFDDIEEHRVFATSKDGTKIPMSILFRTGSVLNGSNPTLLYGYGGYGLSSLPGVNIYLRSWFDRGGIYAVANIRGGGEYGEPWHQAGMLLKKQNGLDDFAACAHYLIDHRYTNPARLAAHGVSNGGITVGSLITQHPTLARAAVCDVGVLDVLRSELEPNGEFNVTEYGTVKDREQFTALYNYSPYNHVEPGAKYPAVLFSAGENDHRVASWHAKKMAAKLQADSGSDLPVFLKVSSTAGHGFGTAFEETLRNNADMFAFLFDQLGMSATKFPSKN